MQLKMPAFTTNTKHALVTGVTFCFALVTLGFVSYHTTSHCEIITGGITSDECPADIVDVCKSEAPALKIYTASSDNKISCSWRAPTAIIGLICLILSFLYILIFAFMACGKAFRKEFLVVAGIVLVTTVITLALMIADISKGSSYFKNTGDSWHYKPGSYIANILLLFFSGVMFALMAVTGYKMKINMKVSHIIPEQKVWAENPVTNREDMTEFPLESQATNRVGKNENKSLELCLENQPTLSLENPYNKSMDLNAGSHHNNESRFGSRFEGSLFDINLREKVIKAHLQTQPLHYGFGTKTSKTEFALTHFETSRSHFIHNSSPEQEKE